MHCYFPSKVCKTEIENFFLIIFYYNFLKSSLTKGRLNKSRGKYTLKVSGIAIWIR